MSPRIERAPALNNPWKLNENQLTEADKQSIFKYTFKNEQELTNLSYIIKDVLSGDPEAARRPEYAHLNLDQIRIAIEWLTDTKVDTNLKQMVLDKPWAIAFKDEPPTPEKFLTSKYIGAMSESVWFPVRKAFIEFFNPLKPYRNAILNPSIGSGKALTLDTKVWTSPKNFVFMKDLKISDKIQNPDGTKSKIISINPQGKVATYRIRMSNGESIKCNLQHIWRVSYKKDNNGNKIWENVTTEFLIKNKHLKFEIPNNKEESKDFLKTN